MSNIYLVHSAKGSTWKKHKYLKKENGRYYYAKKDGDDESLASKKRKRGNDVKDLLISKKETPREQRITTKGEEENESLARAAKDAEKQKKRAAKELEAKQQAKRAQTSNTMNSLAQFIANQKKVNKTAPKKSSRPSSNVTNSKSVGLTNMITSVSSSKNKKPKLNNYRSKLSTGAGQKSSTVDRSPIGTLSNVPAKKRKTQIKTSTSNVGNRSKATSSNATRATSSNAERATSSNATSSNAARKKKKKR